MRTVFTVLAAALIALPILAAPRPTPTPAADKVRIGEVKPGKEGQPTTPTPAADERKYQTISNASRRSDKTSPPSPTVGPLDSRQQQAGRMPTVTGRVLSQQGRRFTVLVNGKAITFSGAKLQALPEVGDTIDIDSTRTADGQLEATRTSRVKLKGTSR